jgi:hypothetical protein
MKITFDDQKWQRLQDDLSVAQLCGENAGKVYGYAKGALQQAVAAMIGDKDVTPEEAAHTLGLLRKLRNGAQDAAEGFAAAAGIIDDLMRELETPVVRSRRRASSA